MKEFLNLLPKELLVIIILGMIAIFVAIGKYISTTIKKQFEEASANREAQLKDLKESITKTNLKTIEEINKLNEEIMMIKKELDKNNQVSAAALFNLLDLSLRRAEITNVWSTTISRQWWEMFERYMDAGNGVDEGHSLKIRAEHIETNDTKYAENLANYNKHKKMMMEEDI